MAWKKLTGIEGLVYRPGQQQHQRKHNCPDCYYCQMCSDVRCAGCELRGKAVSSKRCRKKPVRGRASGKRKKN